MTLTSLRSVFLGFPVFMALALSVVGCGNDSANSYLDATSATPAADSGVDATTAKPTADSGLLSETQATGYDSAFGWVDAKSDVTSATPQVDTASGVADSGQTDIHPMIEVGNRMDVAADPQFSDGALASAEDRPPSLDLVGATGGAAGTGGSVATGGTTSETGGSVGVGGSTATGGSTGTPVIVSAAPVLVTGVSLNTTSMNLTTGGATGSLVATMTPANATNTNVSWTSSNSAIASVSSSGLVSPVAVGAAVITATTADGAKTATCSVIVSAASFPVTGVSLNTTSMNLTVGGAAGSLVATMTPANATNTNVSWTSSNSAIASVSSSGLVSPVAVGAAVITATTADGAKTATCSVIVSAASVPVTGVSLNTTSMNLTVGGAAGSLVATMTPANATNTNVSWTSSNSAIASVSSSGLVAPVAVGTAVITATTADGDKTATCSVIVSAASVSVTGVSLNTTSMNLTVGGAAGSLVATITPANATNTNVSWTSSNSAIASVSSSGLVSPVAAGTAVITATTADGAKIATCSIIVSAASVSVTGVSLNTTSMNLTVGGAAGSLVATMTPANATNTNVSWTSSNSAIASVSSSGLVSPVAVGAAVITATTADGAKTGTCSVIVSAASVPVTGVSLNTTSMNLTAGGAAGPLVATMTPANATNTNVSWTSSNSAIASVSSSGLVSPVAVGTAVITATTADGAKTATCSVTVATITEPWITSFTSSSPEVAIGSSVTLTAIFENGEGVLTPGNIAMTSGVSRVVAPTVPTKYTLKVADSFGSTAYGQLSVNVYLENKYTYSTVGSYPIKAYFQFSKTGIGWFLWQRTFPGTIDSWSGRFSYTIQGTKIDIYWKDGDRSGTHSTIDSFSSTSIEFEGATYRE